MASDVADTRLGRIRGVQHGGITVFKGIRYAEPPVGELRFRPPRPIAGWTGVLEALEYGPSCPQPTQRPAGWSQETSESEDCLFLNVWTPGVGDGRGRPVMVWIHGGGYAIGSGSWPLYDGERLARRGDVVVVTINHRLGPLGYMHLGEIAGDEFAASGNNGMLDLVVMLEWVRDNITAFGGDPGNVTVFGESGGGAKISTLLAMPAARGLFHRAVMQSGPGLQVTPVDRATTATRGLLERLDIKDDDLSALWTVPADAIVRPQGGSAARRGATSAAGGGGGMRGGFGPVLDGSVIPAHPRDALRDGTAIDVPVLIGCNKDEFGSAAEIDESTLRQRLAVYGEDNVDEIVATYKAEFPAATPAEILRWAGTDAGMRGGSIRLAEAKLKGTASPVFMYFFTYELRGLAAHGYEIAFVFDNMFEPVMRPSPTRVALAEQMSEAWIAFARDGDPGHAGIPKWPAYTIPERATMFFGRDGSHIVDDPSPGARELWAKLPSRRMARG